MIKIWGGAESLKTTVMILHRVILRSQRSWKHPRKLEGLISSWASCDSRMSEDKVLRDIILKTKGNVTWRNDADNKITFHSLELWIQIYPGIYVCHPFC